MVYMMVRLLCILFIAESLMIKRHLGGSHAYMVIEYIFGVARRQSIVKLLKFLLCLSTSIQYIPKKHSYPNSFEFI